MADNFPTFPFTTQEDWYGEISFISADDSSPLSLEGRNFVMLITPAISSAALVEPKITLTMDPGGGLSLKNGDPSTIIFRVEKETANDLARMEYTADVLEVSGSSRYLFMPARIQYFEPSALRTFLSRFLGVKVSFAARRQPIITPVAVPGRQGDRGNSVLSESRPPTPADGIDGDFFFDLGSTPKRLYGAKAAGAWPSEYIEILQDVTPSMEEARDLAAAAAAAAAADREAAVAAKQAADQAAAAASQDRQTAQDSAMAASASAATSDQRATVATQAAGTASNRADFAELMASEARDYADIIAATAFDMGTLDQPPDGSSTFDMGNL